VVEQGQHLATFLSSLRAAEFCRTVPGTTERVRDVTAHLLVTQNQLLDALERTTTERPHPLTTYLSGRRLSRHQLVELADELAEHEPGQVLATQFAQHMHEIGLQFARTDLPEVLSTPTPLRLGDLLRLITVEWVLRSDDLTRAIPGHRPIQWHRGVVAEAVRTLAETMRMHHPGQEVEIRVPPFAAVQCGSGEGPRHTRGTPPNVVECDPIPFVRLCRGRQSLPEAVRQGHIRASGVRADISDWLPLY
jgi:hypothetical protein